MVKIYYFLRSIWKLKQFDCVYDRWADVRNALEKQIVQPQQLGKRAKTVERQSFMGCVVSSLKNLQTINFDELIEKSRYLPLLENGSVLLQDDVVILARVPLRNILYAQDMLHRFWLVSLLRQYFDRGRKHNDKKIAMIESVFQKSCETYNVNFFISRILVTTKKASLERNFEVATQVCNNPDFCYQLEFSNHVKFCFGQELRPIIVERLKNVCIDMNRRTKFMSRIIHESGGEIETSDVIAERYGITDFRLKPLVRDVIHAYEPQHCSINAVIPEEEEVKDEEAEEVVAKKPRIEESESPRVEEFLEDLTLPRMIEPKTEEQRLRDATGQVEIVTAPQRVVYNTQLYCLTCDVPGHHTYDCPRGEFMEYLRNICHVSWEVFYSPENGICPISYSSLATFASNNFCSKAGIINRKTLENTVAQFELPHVARFYDLRWIAD